MSADLLGAAYLLRVPVLLVAADGTVVAVNRAAERELAWPADAIGTPLHRLANTSAETVAEYLRLWTRSPEWCYGGLELRTGESAFTPYRVEGARYVPRDGDAAHALLRLTAQRDAANQFTRLNRHLADLTEEIRRRKRLEQEREQLLERERTAREQAEVANRLKDEFLATLSHELRTPLNAILGWAHILRERGLISSEGEHGRAVIERNARLQAQLIDDMLDVSRILTGQLRLEMRTVDLATIVDGAVDTIRPAAAKKGIALDIARQSLNVLGDAARLQQVVWNLLSNAVKFTPPGGTVSLRIRRHAGSARVEVADTGQGIDPAFLPLVFEPFRQADGSITRSHSGLGLGLALVRSFIEAQGGSVRAESDGEGRGATFTLELPLVTADDEAADDEPPRTAARELSGMRILVVEDDPDSRELIALMLMMEGAEVTAVASVTEALAAMDQAVPDLLLADLAMPEETGFDLIRAVRSRSGPAGQVTAIAVTAFASARTRDEALGAGFDAHVAKPLEPPVLLAAIVGARQRAHNVQANRSGA